MDQSKIVREGKLKHDYDIDYLGDIWESKRSHNRYDVHWSRQVQISTRERLDARTINRDTLNLWQNPE